MPPNSSAIDWVILRPKILRLLSEGKTQKDVVEEVSRDGPSITKSQLEYKLKCWGRRTKLNENAWLYVHHRRQKRARNKKKSAVFFNGALLPDAKVVKETRRHVRPTLLPEPGVSPKCPEGFHLIICTPPPSAQPPVRTAGASPKTQNSLLGPTSTVSSLPWQKFTDDLRRNMTSTSIHFKIDSMNLTSFNLPKLPDFPSTPIDFCDIIKTPFGVERLDQPYIASLGRSEESQAVEEEFESHRGEFSMSEIATLLSLHVFETANNLSTGPIGYDMNRLSRLGNILKHVAKISSSWKDILTAGAGATSRAVVEKLFGFSVISQDRTLAELMLDIGADPNQQIFDWKLGTCVSALDYSIGRTSNPITNLLFELGAVYGQTTLKNAILARDLDKADHMLKFDQSLDVNFNYLDTIDQRTISFLGQLKLEKATLLGLVCLDVCTRNCDCDASTLSNESHSSHCLRYKSIISIEFLLRRGATLNLDTMIMASFNADVVTLRVLMRHGGKVDGFNNFGFSCLDAASLRNMVQYDIFSLLLASEATATISRTHHVFGSRACLLHCLLLGHPMIFKDDGCKLHSMVDLFINSGADIDYRARPPGSPSELALAHDKFLWSQSIQQATSVDLIAQSKAESPLEYAIVVGCEGIAFALVNRDCQLTGREITLAVRMGSNLLLNLLIERDRPGFDKASTRRTCLRLALRWGHEKIVRNLLGKGVDFGAHDMIDALQYPGRSVLSTKTQIELIRATPSLERMQIFGLSLLELCSLKFSGEAVRDILTRFPEAYDSGTLVAIVRRTLDKVDPWYFALTEFRALVSRRTKSNCDWGKENTALLVAAQFNRPDLLRILLPWSTTCVIDKAWIPREDLSWFLTPKRYAQSSWTDPTYSIGCQDWVPCSPLMGIAMAPQSFDRQEAPEDTLTHLLAFSYEPDALTVVVAAANGKLGLLHQLQRRENWQSILSIDNESRPLWCPTALQVAVSKEDKTMVEFLLEAGTSVNEAPAGEAFGNCLPRTALQAAVDNGNVKMMEFLVQHGADANAVAAEDSGATALQLACIHGSLMIGVRLLQLGADANAKGARINGRTALEGAAEHGRIDTIWLLLKNHGACTDGIYREQYLKAVLYAEKNGHFAAAALLKKHRVWSPEDEECFKNLQLEKLYNE